MNVVLLVIGLVVLSVTLTDFLATTVSVGAGRRLVSGWLTARLWQLGLRLGRNRRRALSLVGPILVVALLLLWVALAWGSWGLMFVAAPDHAVLVADTETPATAWERLYLAGYSMTTLGPGGIETNGAWWQLCEVLCSLTGLVLATLGITFLLSVVSGVVDKRSLAADLHSLGSTPRQVLDRGWDGHGWHRLEPALQNMTSDLNTVAQQHLAYPVLHYFQSPDRTTALGPSLAVVDEALTEITTDGDPDHLDPLTLERARTAAAVLLATLSAAFISPAAHPPPRPQHLAADPPAASGRTRPGQDEDLEQRRRVLLAFVQNEGWDWDADVRGEPS